MLKKSYHKNVTFSYIFLNLARITWVIMKPDPTIHTGVIMENETVTVEEQTPRFDKVKKFVSDHKVAIAVTATSFAWAALHRISVNQYETFLEEHDLLDEYWTVTDDEE